MPVNSPIQTVAELKGHTIAFSDPGSTSGNLMPRYALIQAGLNPDKDVKIEFAGGHPQSLLALVNGKVDAGEINSQQQATATAAHQFDPSKFRVDLALEADPERPDHGARQSLARLQVGGHEGAAEADARAAEALDAELGVERGADGAGEGLLLRADPGARQGRRPHDHGRRLIASPTAERPGADLARSAPAPFSSSPGCGRPTARVRS